MISSAAAKVLRHVADARGCLQGDEADKDAAMTELEQAERLLDIIIAATLPTAEVEDRIWVVWRHLEYEGLREVVPDLAPIFASPDELTDCMPVDPAKGHLDKAKEALGKYQKSEAQEALRHAGEALVYVEADLPLGFTRALVADAKPDLAENDIPAANQALALVGTVGAETYYVHKLAERILANSDATRMQQPEPGSIASTETSPDCGLWDPWVEEHRVQPRIDSLFGDNWQRMQAGFGAVGSLQSLGRQPRRCRGRV